MYAMFVCMCVFKYESFDIDVIYKITVNIWSRNI